MLSKKSGLYKKSNAPLEIIIIVVVLIVISIIFMIAYSVLSPINTMIQNDKNMPTISKSISSSNTKAYPAVWDNGMVFMLVILSLFAIGFAFMVDTNPMFFFITVFLLIAVIVATVFIANSTINVVSNLGVSSNFPYTMWIYHHLVQIVIIIGMLIAGALYAKSNM